MSAGAWLSSCSSRSSFCIREPEELVADSPVDHDQVVLIQYHFLGYFAEYAAITYNDIGHAFFDGSVS